MRYLLFIFPLLLLFQCTSPKEDITSTLPNILLILTDDQGYGDLSIHDNDSIHTPNLDQLAAESVRFERFYVSQVCAPTRASLLTGRYHPRTGVTGVTSRREVMRAEETTIAEVVGAAGYRTGLFGKWHNGEQYPNDPTGQGFQEFFGFTAGHWNNYFDTELTRNQESVKTEGYLPDILTDRAMNFMQTSGDQPFFCYLAYNTPHSPMQVPDDYFDRAKARGLSDYNAAVYGMVENIDDNIGRMLAQLEADGQRDNTIVLFLTDNGPNGNRYNDGMKGWKGHYDEGGVRVPLFVRYGDFEPRQIDKLAAHIDVLPTLLDICGLKVPDAVALDGRSLLPLLEGETTDWEERSIYSFRHGAPFTPRPGAVRTEQYRWVLGRDSSISLYDMIADFGQTRDISSEQPEVVARLGAAYDSAFQSVTAQLPLPPPIPVGHAEAKRVHLPVIEAQKVVGDLRFKEGHAWANDWIVDWNSIDEALTWEIAVQKAGNYAVEVAYTTAAENIGSVIAVECNEQQVEATISEAFDPDYMESPDRIVRKEVYEKEWARLSIGELYLPEGKQELSLRALSVLGDEVAEVKGIWLLKK
ncbi:MAG: arylsulfatase [Bacteroidota bacterium]